ncbi:MAG TPA: SulP family inorganic anion transporter [Vicinamibacterales bacterium]|nr:SulP family inorganic anion transporter [Vicinamibacterales bacterium]
MTGTNPWMPGLALFRTYRREWLASDVRAGLSVAAVAVPIAIAYSQIAGVPPEVGIYSAIFPPLAYAMFGTSRQLIVNPDSAAAALIASTLAPLAAVGTRRYLDLSVALALAVGLLSVAGGVLKLGVVANFLARPILTGYTNGIAATILVGQLSGFLGMPLEATAFVPRILEALGRISDAHGPTAALGLSLFVLLRLLKRYAQGLPGPLVAAVLAVMATMAFGFGDRGVALVGSVPAGFPAPRLPRVTAGDLTQLFAGACSMALVSYCSMMPTARSFATRRGYALNANQEFVALGAANLASGLGQGFVVSGADSRTAVGDAAGGKTQLTGIVAALAMSAVLIFLTGPLALLPRTALSAIVISAVVGMFDLRSPMRYFRIHPVEGVVSVVTTAGVIALGLLPGLLVALVVGFLRLLMLASYPHDAVLGVVETPAGLHASDDVNARRITGLVMYRFDSALLFFNADYFRERLRAAVDAESTPVQWVLIDAESMPLMDLTGAAVIDEMRRELAQKGIVLAVARAKGRFLETLERSGLRDAIGERHMFATMRDAVEAFAGR